MQRHCQIIRLRGEAREEYIRYHEAVWPSVLATIAACNIRNYSIYLHADLLIAYFEYHGVDFAADARKMAADPETQRWWAIRSFMSLRMISRPTSRPMSIARLRRQQSPAPAWQPMAA